MLINELEKANMEALKNKDKDARAILSVVINNYRLFAIELKAEGKEGTDADVIRVIQKAIKELDDELEGYIAVNNQERVQGIKLQKEVISKFLPAMMSEKEIRSIIAGLDDKSIPSIMKTFKMKYNGKCDMGLVNRIARELQ
jgi:uncharacterized protein YqeY